MLHIVLVRIGTMSRGNENRMRGIDAVHVDRHFLRHARRVR